MKIVHISDTHGVKGHSVLEIPECDVLCHTGDIGGRTTANELEEFLRWFSVQPAKHKIFIAGNHDICLSKDWLDTDEANKTVFTQMKYRQDYSDAKEIIAQYADRVTYLENSGVTIEGFNFWGSPQTPSFHRKYWVFNADRGEEIDSYWQKIPKDTNVLLTHGPVYNILDTVASEYKEYEGEDLNVGCQNLAKQINKRLTKLMLHCSGHIHDNYGVVQKQVSLTRRVLFSNGAILNNHYQNIITKPLIIDL